MLAPSNHCLSIGRTGRCLAIVASFLVLLLEIQADQVGVLEAYAPSHRGSTASGEIYSRDTKTAAFNAAPFNAYLRITDLKSGRHVTTRINDRLPEGSPVLVRVSKAAAEELGMRRSERRREVLVTVLKPDGSSEMAAPRPPPEEEPTPRAEVTSVVKPIVEVEPLSLPLAQVEPVSEAAAPPTPSPLLPSPEPESPASRIGRQIFGARVPAAAMLPETAHAIPLDSETPLPSGAVAVAASSPASEAQPKPSTEVTQATAPPPSNLPSLKPASSSPRPAEHLPSPAAPPASSESVEIATLPPKRSVLSPPQPTTPHEAPASPSPSAGSSLGARLAARAIQNTNSANLLPVRASPPPPTPQKKTPPKPESTSQQTAEAPPVPLQRGYLIRFGYHSRSEDAEFALENLHEVGVDAEIVPSQEGFRVVYWLQSPTYATSSQARRKLELAQLKTQEYRDAFIIPVRSDS